jgi:hypothetical protein
VSAGVCSAGRIGTVVTAFGLPPAFDGAVVRASAEAPAATNINVATSIDLMRSLGVIDVRQIKHICLVGNNRCEVRQKMAPLAAIASQAVARMRDR